MADTMTTTNGYIQIQGVTLKAIVALMKELVTEVTISFEENRLEIIGFDAERISIMKAVTVDENTPGTTSPVRVSILIQDLYKSIRTTEKTDMVLLITEGAPTCPILVTRILSSAGDRDSWYKLPALTINPDMVVFPLSDSPPITVETSSFQKAVREIGHSHERVMLRYDPLKLRLVIDSLHGSKAGGRASVAATSLRTDKHESLYFTKHLQKFLRIAASPQVEVQLELDRPAVFSYHKDNFVLRLAVSPIDQTER